MHFVAWNGERWSAPFEPCDLIPSGPSGFMDREGCSVTWDADGYRGENWIALIQWTKERAQAIMSNTGRDARREEEEKTMCKENTTDAKGEPAVSSTGLLEREPTDAEAYGACMYMRHDFGLLPSHERKEMMFEARLWLISWSKVNEDNSN